MVEGPQFTTKSMRKSVNEDRVVCKLSKGNDMVEYERSLWLRKRKLEMRKKAGVILIWNKERIRAPR